VPYAARVEPSRAKTGLILGLASLFLLGFEGLIFFEFIRPFRDNNIDQPLGLCGAGLGALLSLFALWRRQGAIALNVIALLLNISALVAVGLIAWSLSHMKLM
jgi:hypothetical protein